MSLAGIALWIFVIVIAIVFLERFLYIRKFCILPVEFGIHAFRSDCAGISDGNNCTEQRRVDRNCEYHFSGNVLSGRCVCAS